MILNLFKQTNHRLRIKKNLELITQLVDRELGEKKGYVNLILCDDKTIRKLNKIYREKDKVTDVLTFTYFEGKTDARDLLGEIFIDLEQTKRQAHENSNAPEEELYNLFIHGLLHLRGFDHETDRDFRVMKLLENKILKSFKTSWNM